MAKITLLTYCNSEFRDIGDVSIPVMREYCNRQGIIFSLHTEISSNHGDVYWNKISIVNEALKDSDWVIWCDADIIIKTLDFNWNVYLEKLTEKDIAISSDFNGLCMGFFIVRSCEWSFRLFSLMEALGNIKKEKIGIYHKKNQREQDTIKVLADFFDVINSRIELIPENILANPRTDPNIKESFGYHFWASRDVKSVAIEMKEYLAESCIY
jgi:hypothetical protein